MAKTIEFYFDFGSPNAYLAHHAIKGVLDRTGAQVAYRPMLLGGIFKATNNQPPMMAYSKIKGKLEYERLEFERFVKRHQLSRFVFNSRFPVNTLLLMRAAMVAQRDGYLDAYIEAGLKALWEDDKNMADPEVFSQSMTEAGFNGAELLAGAGEDAIKTALADATSAAVERGVFGSPTFFVGSEMFFGKERLGQVEEELAQNA